MEGGFGRISSFYEEFCFYECQRIKRSHIKFSENDAVIFPSTNNNNANNPDDAPNKLVFLNEDKERTNMISENIKGGHKNYQESSIYPSSVYLKDAFIYNTGEAHQSLSNNFYQRPAISFHQFHPYGERENPNYSYNSNAQNYYYEADKILINNLQPTVPPSPLPEKLYMQVIPKQQIYQNYGLDQQQQQSYSEPEKPAQFSYAGLFNNLQPISSPLASLFNGFSGAGGSSSALASRITKALKDISENDDLNCVPKLLCQMIGRPERRRELPGFFSASGISWLLSVLPATSPVLSFGKAALLGYTSGEETCEKTYNKCPAEEDELLYYLNNHRGGFFRFFNEGLELNEANKSMFDQHSLHGHYPVKTSKPIYSGTSTNQANMQTLLASSDSLGILGSLTSLLAQGTHSSDMVPNMLISIVGNLLGGLINEGRVSRLKRSSQKMYTMSLEPGNVALDNLHGGQNKTQSSRAVLLDEDVEGRIINRKANIQAEPISYYSPIQFPMDDESNNSDNLQFGTQIGFEATKIPKSYIRYPPHSDIYEGPIRMLKRLNFMKASDSSFNKYSVLTEVPPQQLKMVFSDRKGTGNLRFDNIKFERDNIMQQKQSPRNQFHIRNNFDNMGSRTGKTLTMPSYIKYDTYLDNDDTDNNQWPYYHTNSHWSDPTSSNNCCFPNTRLPYHKRYETPLGMPSIQRKNVHRYADFSDTNRPGVEGNLYVTDSQGVVDHYIKQNGQTARV